MKIAFFQRDLPPQKIGGVAKQVHLLAEAIVKKKHSVDVFSLTKPDNNALYSTYKVPISHKAEKNNILKKHFLGYYFSKVNINKYDIIHCHGDNYFMFNKHPQVRTFYGSAFAEAWHAGSFKRTVSQLVFWKGEIIGSLIADYKTAISEKTKKYLPFIDKIVPCGIDLSKYKPDQNKKEKEPTILFVGDIKGRKNGHKMLSYFESINKKILGCQLWMVSKNEIKMNNVYFFDSISEEKLIDLYQRSWILCSLSSYEGFGLPLLEAMACGTPVISFTNDGADYVLNKGRYGIITNQSDFINKVFELLKNKNLRDRYINIGLQRSKKFDINKIADTYLNIYSKIINKNG